MFPIRQTQVSKKGMCYVAANGVKITIWVLRMSKGRQRVESMQA